MKISRRPRKKFQFHFPVFAAGSQIWYMLYHIHILKAGIYLLFDRK